MLKQYIELEVYNNLWITSKGKAVLNKIKVIDLLIQCIQPDLEPLKLWQNVSQGIDIQLQALSLSSKHLATINENSVQERAEAIYKQTIYHL